MYQSTMDEEREAPLDLLDAWDDEEDEERPLIGAAIPTTLSLSLTTSVPSL
jgi:hypothetical protein